MSFVNPAPGATEGRTDEGVDWGNVHSIVAVAKGVITNVYYGLSGFGTTIIERLTSGQYIYYATETSGTTPSVHAGETVAAGQQVAGGGSGGAIEVGFWNPATGRAVAAPGYQEGQPTAEGQKFRNMLSRHSPASTSSGPSTWWAVKVSLEASSSGTGWTELSSNGNGAGAAGKQQSASCTGSSVGGCDFATLGRMYPKGTIMRFLNPNTGKSALAPLTDYGNGSSFGPAVGVTPALQAKLGGVQSGQTLHIQLASGQDMNVVSGFGTRVGGPSSPVSGASGHGGTRPGGQQTNTAAVDSIFADYIAMRDAPRVAPAQSSPSPLASFQWWWSAFLPKAQAVFSGQFSQVKAVGQAVATAGQPQQPQQPKQPSTPKTRGFTG